MTDQSRENPKVGEETEADAQTAKALAARYWRRRLALRAGMLLIFAPIVFVAIASIMMVGREVTAPSWIVRTVEARAAEVLGGGSLEFGDIKITVGDDFHPRLVLRNAVVRDQDSIVLARIPAIEGQLSPRGILQGRVLAQVIHLEGAQINLRRAADGTVAVAFDSGASDVRSADTFVELLDQFDDLFEAGALEALEQVKAEGLIINYFDSRVGRSWTVDSGRLDLDLRGGVTALSGGIELLSGRSYVTSAEMSYVSERGSSAAEVGLNIQEAAAADIASQAPVLSWLGVLDAPISGALRGQIDDAGDLTDVSATLQIGAGELHPNAETRPVPFDGARTYVRYDPAADRLTFDLVEVDSDWGRVTGSGVTYLREYENGWPGAILGQIRLEDLSLNPGGVYSEAQDIGTATVDFRLRLDPFSLRIGQAVFGHDGEQVLISGDVVAANEGWVVGLDGQSDALDVSRITSLWPPNAAPKTRDWIVRNLPEAQFHNVSAGFRSRPGEDSQFATSLEFEDATIQYMPQLPPIEGASGVLTIAERRFSVALDRGHAQAAEGGQINVAGSQMVIPLMGIPNPPAEIDLELTGTVTAAMSVLNQPPFEVLRNSDFPVALADGRMRTQVQLRMPLGRNTRPQDRVWTAQSTLSNLRSTVIVPDRTMTASQMTVRADRESLVIRGGVRVGQVDAQAVFSRALGPGSEGTARVEADVALSQAFLEEFNIGLPSGTLRGLGQGQLALDLGAGDAPAFRLTSNLRGVALALPAIGWAKGQNSSGDLLVTGVLGDVPRIDRLRLDAAGLTADGSIQISAGGGLERAAFEQVEIGGWFNAPVVLVGRGAGQPVGIQIAGGALDLRRADFGTGGDEGGPMQIALDRLQISEGIALRDFRGEFTSQGGFTGEFTGSVNGQAPVRGTVIPVNGRSAVRLQAADAGSVFGAADLLRNARGGAMVLTLLPTGAEGTYDGTLQASDLRVKDAPALASLLDAISVVGLLTQLDGQGLMFSEVDAEFRLTPSQIIVTQSSAVGPGLGISLDGTYASDSRTMDFQGVVSPFFLLNGIGSVLTRPGEGLIGFNFNLRGSVDSPRVLVNPLSALTPGMFRDIFRRPPPTVNQ